MAGSVNKVILIGNLGKDPELRQTNTGNSVANFSVATTERWTNKAGEKQEETEWHNIVMFGKQADIASQFLSKGSSVYVEGKLKTSSWDNNGVKAYKTEIVANHFTMLDKKSDGGGQQQQDFRGHSGSNQANPTYGQQPQQPQQQQGFQQPQQQALPNGIQIPGGHTNVGQQLPQGNLPIEEQLPF